MITQPFTIGEWTFSRNERYVVIDLRRPDSNVLRLSIPVDVWTKSVFSLISIREVLDHDLVLNSIEAKRIREGAS